MSDFDLVLAGNVVLREARFWRWLTELARLTEPERPWTRRAFSTQHAQGRQWIAAQMRALGLTVSIDASGNLIGRREGSAPGAGTIMIGSHSDTVVGGGRFDGIAGVIAGLEIAAALADLQVRLRCSLEIVPGEARLTVDLRSDAVTALDAWTERIRELAERTAAGYGVRLSDFRVLSSSLPTACAPPLASALRESAAKLDLSQQDIVSGAGHDAAFVARIAPAAMLFVTSRGGLSHCAEEWTEPQALAKGIAVLLGAVQRVDAAKDVAYATA